MRMEEFKLSRRLQMGFCCVHSHFTSSFPCWGVNLKTNAEG